MIKVEKPAQQTLDELGVENWPVWEKEISEFPWYYDEKEVCYILEGHVYVTPKGGEAVEIQAGDLAEFPQGMHCTWKIVKNIRKHYQFG